jgi:CRP-like cAMP-binding protein
MTVLDTEVARPALIGLRGIGLLHGLGDEVLLEVARACRFQRVHARQTVITRSDAEHDCCFVISGRLRVVALSPSGREISFRDATAGETIGEIAALDGRPRSATVVAQRESLLARIGAAEFKTLLRRHWPICERLLQHLARTARTLTERVYELTTLSVQQRLCAELLRLVMDQLDPAQPLASIDHLDPDNSARRIVRMRQAGTMQSAERRDREGASRAAGRVVLRPAPNHSELAMRISTLREQVVREMGELARQGLVRRESETDAAGAREREVLVIEDLRRLAERIEGP